MQTDEGSLEPLKNHFAMSGSGKEERFDCYDIHIFLFFPIGENNLSGE